jgi:glycosyltransferase involved in cell wall biosynthesis
VLAYSGIDPAKAVLTYEAAELENGDLQPYELPFKRFIMYVGQQPDYKNIRRLAAAHQKLLKKHPDLGLVLVGRKAKDTLKNESYFKAKGYTNIHFTGYIDDPRKHWLYTNTAAYVFPSLMEGFGLPPLEAMLGGAPVAASNASCIPEILGEAAEYFDPLSIDDMVAATMRVIDNPERREQLIKKGTAQVKKYSWRRMAQQTHEV